MSAQPDSFDFWTPGPHRGEGDSLNQALQAVGLMPRAEARRVVEQLIRQGHLYEAGRCLEVMAQTSLGVIPRPDELLGRRRPGFGQFHDDIRALMQAGSLFHRSRRPQTGWATFQRALIFVEEALRCLEDFSAADPHDACCLGLAFELAGHCCAAIDNADGLEYYKAAQDYWHQSEVADPGTSQSWEGHQVTRTVIASLEPVVAIKQLEPALRVSLFSTDHHTRLDTAKASLC